MSTQREKIVALHFNRFLVWILVVIGAVIESPFTITDALSIVAATVWLWLPQLARLELKVIEYIKRRG
jgi:hypothetical protein